MVLQYAAQVGDHSIPGIEGTNSPEGMDVRLLYVLCFVHMAPLRRVDDSSRGVIIGVRDLENSTMRRPRPEVSSCVTEKQKIFT